MFAELTQLVCMPRHSSIQDGQASWGNPETLSNSSPGWGNKCCITQTRFGIEIRDWGKAGNHTVTAAHTAAWRNCENEKEIEGLQG